MNTLDCMRHGECYDSRCQSVFDRCTKERNSRLERNITVLATDGDIFIFRGRISRLKLHLSFFAFSTAQFPKQIKLPEGQRRAIKILSW